MKLHWLEDGDSDYEKQCRANSLIEDMRNLEMATAAVHRGNHFNFQLYSNRFLASFDWGTGYYTQTSLEPVSSTTDNVVVEVVDAMLAEVGKARPKAKPICHGASFDDRRNAKKLDKFLWGEFVRNDIYEEGKKALLNAEVCGFGCIKVCADDTDEGTKIRLENIFPDEILINQQEVLATGEVRTVYRRRVLPIEVVAQMFDIDEAELEPLSSTEYIGYREIGKGYTVLGEAYRTHGKHVIAVKDRILMEEDWDHCWLPFVFLHYARPMHGFYTQSLVELVLPDQIRLNEINEVIEEAQRLFCAGRLLVPHGSKIATSSLDNSAGRIITYTGAAPEAVTWPAVSGELYAERDRLKAGAFAKAGLNQAASSGALPPQARLDSSPAVRELNSVQDSRLADLVQRYEKFYMDLAKTMIKVLKLEGKDATTVWFPTSNHLITEKIEWKSIDLDDNSYTITLEPASSFSMTPSAIRDDLESKLSRGEISPEQYHDQLRQYDPDALISILSATKVAIDSHQAKLENGEFVLPDRSMDLVLGLEQMLSFYNLLLTYDDQDSKALTDAKLATLNWIEAAKSYSNEAAQPSIEQSMAPPAMPQMPAMQPMMQMQ